MFKRLAVVVLVLCHAALAAEPVSPAGHWQGAIELPGAKLELDVDLLPGEAGGFKGDVSIPSQNLRNAPLGNVAVDGASISFEIPGIPGQPTFKGTLAGDGKSFAGTFSQGGASFPFRFERAGAPAKSAAESLVGFDAFVPEAIRKWEVPGLAIAIVRDGQVVYAKGFGVREVGKDALVTTKTLFAIGSSTKAFTTFVMGTLVDEGKLDWDKPVREFLPSFMLKDPIVSERMTPRDLVTHRSGLPRHDMLWYNGTLTRKELVERLAYLESTADLRTKFQYNNLMFLTAGYLVEQVTGKSWEDNVRERVFGPLGMDQSLFSVVDMQKAADFAKPHDRRDEKVVAIPYRDITIIGPAGSIDSSADDMAKWALVHLNGGVSNGKSLIRKATLDELHRPQMVTGDAPERPDISPTSYALGWFVDTYRGHARVSHGGAIDGFGAMVMLFPNDGLGIVVLQNFSYNGLPGIVAQHAADLILGLPGVDWSGEALAKRDKARAEQKEGEKKKEATRKTGTKPSHPLADYAGDYEHPGYGTARLRLDGGKLIFSYNGIATPLEPWHYDVFDAEGGKDPTFEHLKILFRGDVKGNIAALEFPIEPALEPAVFKKTADPRMSDPGYLARLVGSYDLAALAVTFGLKGTRLTLSVPGQPEYTLRPQADGTFAIEGLNGFSVSFATDAKGEVTGVVFDQPNGVFEGKRKR